AGLDAAHARLRVTLFVFVSDGPAGWGARRIEAVTSSSAFGLLHERSLEAEELRSELAETRKQARKRGAGRDRAADVVYRDESGDVVGAQVEAIKGSQLRGLSDQIRQSKKAAAVLLGSVDDGRVYLVVNVDPSLVDAGVDAVAIAREAAKKIEGGGGGRPNLAEAGGKNPAGLDEAFEVGKSEIAAARG